LRFVKLARFVNCSDRATRDKPALIGWVIWR